MSFAPVAVVDPGVRALDPRTFTAYSLSGVKGPEAFSGRLACLEFRGSGVIGGVFYTRLIEIVGMVEKYENVSDLIKLMAGASGSFTLVIFDRVTRDLYFLNDPLGGGFILRYTDNEFIGVSTDLTSLRYVVQDFGRTITRDYLYELAGFATGTQHNAADTPFQEITVEDSGFGLRISAEGVVESLDYGVNDYLYSGSRMSEEELVAEGTRQIKENLSAVLNYDPSLIVSDITGGFDSRLVLAGISALDATDSIVLRSIRPNAEWPYAESLAATYGMQLTDGKGFGEVWGIRHDLYEDSVVGARKSGGLIANEGGANSLPYPVVKLQGGYGGTFRTAGDQHYPDGFAFDVNAVVKNRWKWATVQKLVANGDRIFKDSFSDGLAKRAERTLNQGIARGIPNSHMSSYWYGKGRLRYWFGQQSYHCSRAIAQFDPLYNTALIAAAYRTSFERRRANMIGLKAMKSLDSKLIEYPFFNPGLPTKKFLSEHPDIGNRPFEERSYEYRKLDFSPVARIKRDLRRDEITTEDATRATELSLRPEHIAGVRKWGEAGYWAISSNSDLSELFSLPALRNLLVKPTNRQEAQGAIGLIGSLFRAGLIAPESRTRDDEFIFS